MRTGTADRDEPRGVNRVANRDGCERQHDGVLAAAQAGKY